MKNMKIAGISFLVVIFYSCSHSSHSDEVLHDTGLELTSSIFTSDEDMLSFFEEDRSDEQVCLQGTVNKILADDNDGARHQRFIIQLGSGQTILIAHNIDLAERIDGLREGDRIEVYGEYEWNDRGV